VNVIHSEKNVCGETKAEFGVENVLEVNEKNGLFLI
jgi:hypothetical protein